MMRSSRKGAKTCSIQTPVNNNKQINKTAEFQWIGFQQKSNTKCVNTLEEPNAMYSTIRSARSAKIAVSKKSWKKRFSTLKLRKKTPLAQQLNFNYNNNNNVETPPDFKIYDFIPQPPMQHKKTPNTPHMPKMITNTTPVMLRPRPSIITTPLPPIPGR